MVIDSRIRWPVVGEESQVESGTFARPFTMCDRGGTNVIAHETDENNDASKALRLAWHLLCVGLRPGER
jgi:hypothetical protein